MGTRSDDVAQDEDLLNGLEVHRIVIWNWRLQLGEAIALLPD
jgi:hypothetical protein